MKLITKWGLVFSVAVLAAVSIPMVRGMANATNEFSPPNLASWRAKGPAGLAQFVALHQKELDENTLHPPKNDPQWTKLCAAMDVIGGQKDDYASRLYWFTDLDKAKVLSKAEHKPILSLRLLGKLTDELSCANSRFFRTALYPNAKISALLRDQFVLYWSSERPVPIVTIDMGDGRKIKRTVTGNSAHYLLSSDGTPLDVLPGLNAPGTFERWLKSSLQLYRDYEATPQNERAAFLAKSHEELLKASILNARENDALKKMLPKIDLTIAQIKKSNPLLITAPPRVPALLAAPLPVGKAVLEMPLLSATELRHRDALDSILSYSDMAKAKPYFNDAKLDANSIALIRAKNPPLDTTPIKPENNNPYRNGNPYVRNASYDNTEKATPFDRLVNNFERALAFDSARNNDLHNYIHAYFAEGKQGNFEELNGKIYGRLFRTPQSDAWLGLDTPGIYTAIDNGGIVEK